MAPHPPDQPVIPGPSSTLANTCQPGSPHLWHLPLPPPPHTHVCYCPHQVFFLSSWKQEAIFALGAFLSQLLCEAARHGSLLSYCPNSYLELPVDVVLGGWVGSEGGGGGG